MIDWFKGFVLNFVLAALLAGLFLLPDHLFQAVTLGYQAAFGEKVVLGIYLFALASRSLWVIKAVALFFAALQLAQFFHFSYFGTLISPHAVAILFTDFGEITESLFSDMGRVLLPLAIVGGGVRRGLLAAGADRCASPAGAPVWGDAGVGDRSGQGLQRGQLPDLLSQPPPLRDQEHLLRALLFPGQVLSGEDRGPRAAFV
ncbi:MAG: hypothetical protein AB2815_05800 [Candidatus Sedimenticola endophacoides]